jgi:tetratricopeptide (TPR) repeat protein
MDTQSPVPPARPRFVYVPALNSPLRFLLAIIFACIAFLGATGFYLLAIRGFEWYRGLTMQTEFSLWMTLFHTLIGLVLVAPFLIFGFTHLLTAWNRPNRVAVRLGITVLLLGIVVGVTGILLIRLEGLPQLPTDTISYWTVFLLHVIVPVLAVVVYVWHRKAGPAIKWKWGYTLGGTTAAFTVVMMAMHSQNTRAWFRAGSPEGIKYFDPSLARTSDGNFIAAHTLMLDEYCLKCHQDAYNSHQHSMHRHSSFNNPLYLFSVKETRRTAGIRASRWCAGCHDPVPFFSGQFDDPFYNMESHPTASAAITCVVCHSITNINSLSGNADFTITDPELYPFTFSDNAFLQYLNNQMIKAKPELHKKTFLKPFHRSADFCSTCHKVLLPQEVNHYKEALRGQNHHDSHHLSGVSGHGARSFYLPQVAKTKCADCHMPLQDSTDFGARDFDASGKRSIHNHGFIGANTGVLEVVKHANAAQRLEEVRKFLTGGLDGKSPPIRIDIFGLKHLEAGKYHGVDAPLMGEQPLRPFLPTLQPGQSYLVEVVVRTLNIGHHFTQGTVDSNEVWVDFIAKAGGKVVARNGGMSREDEGRVDENAHFINVLMLDRHGNRIDRRNPQDIFTPLYDHQIPPGAAHVLHYRLDLPKDLPHNVELFARVRYRKFDLTYLEHVYGKGKAPKLPIVDMCSDTVTLPVAGIADKVAEQKSPIAPPWQRWNDYGIGCFLEGGPDGNKGGELGQAEKSFRKLLDDEFKQWPDARAHGWLNLARVHLAYGGPDRLEQARDSLKKASENEPPAPWQTVTWFNGLVNIQYANFEDAIKNFEQILDPKNKDAARKFDFTSDYVVINELGKAFFLSAQREEGHDQGERERFLLQAIAQFERTLRLDPENVVAHEFLSKCYARLAGAETLVADTKSTTLEMERLLKSIALCKSHGTDAERVHAASALCELVPDVIKSQPRPRELTHAHRLALDHYNSANSLWARLALSPTIVALDRHLLEALPERGRLISNTKEAKAQRLAALDDVHQVLVALNQKPSQEDVTSALVPTLALPRPGLPANMALAGAGVRGHLQGPLPTPRLLTFYAVRPALHAAFHKESDPELRAAAARALGRMHLVMHGIFKPDENAQGVAVQRYRERHPAAARASQSIIIYPTGKQP